jgi:hypothetical protein
VTFKITIKKKTRGLALGVGLPDQLQGVVETTPIFLFRSDRTTPRLAMSHPHFAQRGGSSHTSIFIFFSKSIFLIFLVF